MILFQDEGTALRFSDEALNELRAAGYTDEAIAGLEGQLGQAAQQSTELNTVLQTGTPDEIAVALRKLQAIPEAASKVVPTPPAERIAAVDAFQAQRLQHLAAQHGMTVEQYIAAVDQHLQTLVSKTGIYKRVDIEDLPAILGDGRLKSQFETNTSGGLLDTSTRDSIERKVLGFDGDVYPVEQRPQYGYLSEAPDGVHPMTDFYLDNYGDAIIRLKRKLPSHVDISKVETRAAR